MNKTIIIHHLQGMWDKGLQEKGSSFDHMLSNTIKHLRKTKYARVIITNFEANFGVDDEQIQLQEFYPEVYDYMYGWERSEVESWKYRKEGIDYCDGGNHSEVVLIDDWMRTLSGKVYLCGAFEGECLEDIEIALNHININPIKIPRLVK